MTLHDCAFIDSVAHREVFHYTDRLGRKWLAFRGIFGASERVAYDWK